MEWQVKWSKRRLEKYHRKMALRKTLLPTYYYLMCIAVNVPGKKLLRYSWHQRKCRFVLLFGQFLLIWPNTKDTANPKQKTSFFPYPKIQRCIILKYIVFTYLIYINYEWLSTQKMVYIRGWVALYLKCMYPYVFCILSVSYFSDTLHAYVSKWIGLDELYLRYQSYPNYDTWIPFVMVCLLNT